MSIALDVGLFFRNSKTKLGLSLANRAVIFTLAFRVGTRSSTWISPETLADECGIQRQNIFEPLKNIISTGIVTKKSSSRHKQKKIYAFSDLIKNYHQMSDESKRKVHEALGDEYCPPVDKSKNQSGKPDSKRGNQSGKPDSYQSGKPDSKTDEKIAASPATSTFEPNRKSPKETSYNNIHKQSNRATDGSVKLHKYPENFYPDDERREMLTIHARRVNLTELELLKKFEAISLKYKTRSNDWQITFEDFLQREMPKRVYEDSTGRKCRYDNQPLYQ